MDKKDIKALALSPLAGFRHKEVIVKEWGGAVVVVREPSAEAWLRWNEITKKVNNPEEGDPELSEEEKFDISRSGDVAMFIDVLLDSDGNTIFSVEDAEELKRVYGPVHTRLLSNAVGMVSNSAEAEKK